MNRVFCFGELLMRLSPELGGKWIHDARMPVYIGGAELNVAMALAKWKMPVRYVTAIPDHYLSHEIADTLGEKQIDTSQIIFSGKRIGMYYLPQGTDLKHAGVIYDREHSSFSELVPGTIDWDRALDGCTWFHFSAISPALNANVAAVCREGLEAASRKGLTISLDLNYRARLWQYDKQPVEVMPELAAYCNVIMGNIWAKEKMLGVRLPAEIPHEKQAYLEQAALTSQAITRRFPKCSQVANTFRFDKEQGIHYYATLLTNDTLYTSREFHAVNIVDKVGSGDCFMAGLIYGSCNGLPPQELIDLAAAGAVQKMSVKGDATTASIAEIKKAFAI